ncbi:MAG: hypothetical protein AAF391_10510 [Bacteroidota bacterium]
MYNDVINIAPSFYGMSLVPRESWEKYGQALLTIAGSDGDVSEPELNWLVSDAAQAVGVSDEVVQAWRSFDFENGDLVEIFEDINTLGAVNFNKLLIYDAIRMASADGEYAEDEKEAVFQAANLLKVKQEDLLSIEALIEMEYALDKMRINIF